MRLNVDDEALADAARHLLLVDDQQLLRMIFACAIFLAIAGALIGTTVAWLAERGGF